MHEDTKLMDINEQEKFIKNYQAVYYAMTAKPDCKSKIFPQDVTVDFADLNELNRLVTEKFKAHYEDAGFIINVTVSLEDLTVIEFCSWDEFQKYDFNVNAALRGITIVWEYNAKLPKFKVPQKHTLTVRIADELRPQDMMNLIFSGKLAEMDKLEQEFCPVVARVDFINSLLGDELLAIVERWVDGLNESYSAGSNKIMKNLCKNRRNIAYTINYSTVLFAIFWSMKIFKTFLKQVGVATMSELSPEEFGNIVSFIVILIIACYVIYRIFYILSKFVFRSLDPKGFNRHTFKITKGDKKLCRDISNHVNNNCKKVFISGFTTLLFDVICSIITKLLVG